MSQLIHTCYRIGDIDRSVEFYEALGFEERGRLPIRDEAINTNPKDTQYQQLNTLLKRFPFYDLIKQRIAQGFSAGGTRTTYAQIKPLLGNDLVVGFPAVGSASSGGNQTVVAWKTKDGSK